MDGSNLLAGALANAAAPHLKDLLARKGRKAYDRFVATWTDAFKEHVATTIEKCRYTKNILYREVPVPLRSQYVQNSFSLGQSNITDDWLLQTAKDGLVNALIAGHAGSGKSMFMRWLALSLGESLASHQKIPIFIEIREIPRDLYPLSFSEIVFARSASRSSQATRQQFEIGLESGAFVIILDGLDEVHLSDRERLYAVISDFGREFPRTSLICSSRPDMQAELLTRLSVYRLLPMDLSQVIQVIDNAHFDNQKKSELIQRLRDGLYESHRTFLSNPLLSLIMLMVFDESNSVPDRLSPFFSQVYNTLFFKHDSTKGIFQRSRHTSLDVEQFERVLRAFCFFSYVRNRTSFTPVELIALARFSIEHAGLRGSEDGVSPEAFALDCRQSISFLQEDGIYTTFIHRSLQEYFCARYLIFYRGDRYRDVVDEAAARGPTDLVIPLMFEMSPSDLERRWLVPTLQEIVAKLCDLDWSDPLAIVYYLQQRIGGLLIDEDTWQVRGFLWKSSREGALMSQALDQMYLSTDIAAFAPEPPLLAPGSDWQLTTFKPSTSSSQGMADTLIVHLDLNAQYWIPASGLQQILNELELFLKSCIALISERLAREERVPTRWFSLDDWADT